MPTLGKLYLDNNELTGTIPIELGGLGTYEHILIVLFYLVCLLLYDYFLLLVLTIRIVPFVSFFTYIALQLYLLTDTLYVQNNALTGDWPESFCYDGDAPVDSFGVDCDRVECLCCGDMHCYYSM
jgi:hypothetical protein